MSHADTVRELASILNPQNEARPTVLLGAGASFSSGVPLADESVKRIARRYFAERISGKALPEQVKTSEWMAWLAEQTWFIRDPARLVRKFPACRKASAYAPGVSAESAARPHQRPKARSAPVIGTSPNLCSAGLSARF